MKKVTLFAVVAMAALSFTSCKKDHTCTCTVAQTYSGTTYTTISVAKAKSTKKDAKAWCTGSTTTATVGGTAVTGSPTPTCVMA